MVLEIKEQLWKEANRNYRPGYKYVYSLLLADIFIDLQDSPNHTYVEVVLRQPLGGHRGVEGEGDFLEDTTALHESTMGNVSKLG